MCVKSNLDHRTFFLTIHLASEQCPPLNVPRTSAQGKESPNFSPLPPCQNLDRGRDVLAGGYLDIYRSESSGEEGEEMPLLLMPDKTKNIFFQQTIRAKLRTYLVGTWCSARQDRVRIETSHTSTILKMRESCLMEEVAGINFGAPLPTTCITRSKLGADEVHVLYRLYCKKSQCRKKRFIEDFSPLTLSGLIWATPRSRPPRVLRRRRLPRPPARSRRARRRPRTGLRRSASDTPPEKAAPQG